MGAGVGAVPGPLMPGGDPAVCLLDFMAAALGGMMRAPTMAVVSAFELTHACECAVAVSDRGRGFAVCITRRHIMD
jgi:H+/Cl- antiporter ClcA